MTIDEWIYHYIKDGRLDDICSFLRKVLEICDKFVFLHGLPVMNKIHKLSRESNEWKPA